MKARTPAIVVAALLVATLLASAALSAFASPQSAPTSTQAPTQASPTAKSTQVPPTAVPTQAPAATKAPAGAAKPGALYSTETVPCPSFLTKGAALAGSGAEVEGQTYSCGVVVVPENYAKPNGRTIELFYLKLHSSSQSPAPDPLVYLAGGPGSSGSYEATSNPVSYLNLNQIRERRDIIAYDQRGTGFSNYLLCAPFESAIGILQDRDKNPDLATTLKDLQEKDLGIGYDALRANLCGVVTRELAGVDLGQYNSVVSAQDIAHLTEALGYTDGYDLYGTSYGTRLAQYAMRSTPEHVRSVVLDGVSGVSVPNVMWSRAKRFESYVALFQQCAADAACNAAYPNLAARFGALLDKLEKTPLVFDPPLVVNPQLTFAFPAVLEQIDADFFVQLAGLNNLVFSGGFAGGIPRLILAAEQGDLDFFRNSGLSSSGPAPEQVQKVVPTSGDASPRFKASQPLFRTPFETLLMLAQAAATQADTGIDSQWLSVVLGDLASRLQAGENQADLMEALLHLSVVPNTGTTAQYLTDYATTYLSPSAATAANAVVGQMTRNDVRATMWGIQDIAMTLGAKPDSRGMSNGMTHAFNCADEVAFTSLDVAQKYVDDSPYPQLVVFPMIFNKEFLAACLSYPTTLDRSVTEPVVSDIPALIYLGQIDTQTPVSWGREVAKGLSNSLVVEWNNMGHIAAAHDAQHCAGDIAAAFLDDPTRKPNLTCAQSDAYKLQFVLPATPTPAAKASAPAAQAAVPNTPRLRQLDFAPFKEALVGFDADRVAKVEAVVKDADIATVQAAMQAGKLTSEELTLYFLSRIQKYDETLRTMVELNPNALKEAQAADALRKAGKTTNAMLGVPVTLKDNIETAAPMHTTGGAEILLNNQPKADASFVKQLREAGAVILGKANLSELAGGIMLMPAGVSAVGGQVHNPHGNFSPAGSSAGSGAGTAAYETMVSVGSETSGSLIAPASWNGVVGMYPGHGVVDGANVIPLVKNNDSAGPIGRSVKDVAALLDVIDTQDTDYVAGLDTKALNGVKAAFLKSDVLAQQPNELEDNSDNPAIAQLVTKSLAQAGAKVTDIELTPAGIGTKFNVITILLGGVRHDMVPYLVAAGAPIKTLEDLAAYNLKEPKTRIPYGQGTVDAALSVAALKDAKVYEEATQQAKDMATAALDAAFADNKADLLVSVNNYHSAFYATANYPAISVPLGLRKNGMPVGVTLIGKPGSEAKLLAYAYALEQATKLRVDPDLSKLGQ